jgi:maleylacetoacetate isomerase
MNLKLYGYWRSSATYRVRIALNLKKLDYEYIPVHLVKNGGEQCGDEYQRLNPAMLVPSFVDEDRDLTLNQSLAIIEYLDEMYPDECKLLPEHKSDKARIRMVAQDVACDIQPVSNLRILNALKKDFNSNDEQVKSWCQTWIKKGFTAIEKRLQTRAGKYAFGYSVTLADVCLVPQVYNAIRFGVDMNDYPLISKIYDNCQLLDAFIQASPENQVDAIT